MGFRKWKLKAIWFSSVKTLKTHMQRTKHKSRPWSPASGIWTEAAVRTIPPSKWTLFIGRSLILRVKHKGFNTFPSVQKKDCTGENIEKENNWETFWIAFITTDYLDPWSYLCPPATWAVVLEYGGENSPGKNKSHHSALKCMHTTPKKL